MMSGFWIPADLNEAQNYRAVSMLSLIDLVAFSQQVPVRHARISFLCPLMACNSQLTEVLVVIPLVRLVRKVEQR